MSYYRRLTFRACHGRWWHRPQYTMASNCKRHPSCLWSMALSLPTIPHNCYSNIWDHRGRSEWIAVYSASNDSYNCTIASACLCDIAPDTHCSCRNGARREYSHRCNDNSVAPHSHHASTDRSRCSSRISSGCNSAKLSSIHLYGVEFEFRYV